MVAPLRRNVFGALMPKPTTEAGKWLAGQGKAWKPTRQPVAEKNAKSAAPQQIRQKRGSGLDVKHKRKSVREFVEKNRTIKSHDCVFVPLAQRDIPARVSFQNRSMSAARYMLLLTQGTPPAPDMECRHLCGNGHLSCVNPAHLAWGTRGENISDMSKHRAAGENVQDRIHAID